MNNRNSKPKLIALVDDETTLDQIIQAARAYYEVIPARDPLWAAAWLSQYRDVTVFVASQRLAGSNVALFYRAQAMRNDVMRVMLTSKSEQIRFANIVAQGTINKLLIEPFEDSELLDVICLESAGVEDSPNSSVAG